MAKARIVICLAVLLTAFLHISPYAEAFHLQGEVNTVFFRNDHGYLSKLRFDPIEGKGTYLEWLQIGDYYRQLSLGGEFLWREDCFGETWLLIGLEQYDLTDYINRFFRVGLRTDLPLPWGEVTLEVDLMLDDAVGPFLRYQGELRFPQTWLQGQIGFGNLLGSRDGYAVWVGFDL